MKRKKKEKSCSDTPSRKDSFLGFKECNLADGLMLQVLSEEAQSFKCGSHSSQDEDRSWIPEKNIYSCFIDYTTDCLLHLTVWITTTYAKFLRGWEYHPCLLRNLYVDWEATVRTRHGTTGWFKTGKGVWKRCIWLPSLFNVYSEVPGRMNPKLESRLSGEMSATSDVQMIPL